MLVKEQFPIDEDKLAELAEVNAYWSKAYEFYMYEKESDIRDILRADIIHLEDIADRYEAEHLRFTK